MFRFFVEDDVANAIRLSASYETVFLMSQAYNLDVSLPPRVERVASWNEVLERVRTKD
jgi:hypothetical protein